MHLSRSTWRRLVVALVASAGFVLFYGGVVRDSASERPVVERGQPTPGSRLDFEATAYCKGSMTATGTRVGRRVTGIAAADPDLLPLGSVVTIVSPLSDYDGIYTVLDTGPFIQGRVIDLYMWSCFEALDFGRQMVELRILRYGWDPTNTDPSMIDEAFTESEASARRRGADQRLPRPEPEPDPELEPDPEVEPLLDMAPVLEAGTEGTAPPGTVPETANPTPADEPPSND